MAILGDNTQGAGASNCSSDRIFITRVTASEGGTINSAGAYYDATTAVGTSSKVVLYNAGASAPTTLVAASSANTIPAGGGLVTFTMSGSFTAGDYYIGIVSNDFNAKLQIDSGLSGMDSELGDVGGAYATPPNLTGWSPAATYTDNRVNVYIDYSAASGVPSMMLMGVG